VVDGPAFTLTVVATHLTFIPGWNVRQLRHLVGQVQPLPRPLVLMGDLNLEPDRPQRATGMRPLATVPTYPVGVPERQLDHVLADGPLHVSRPAVSVDTGLSDHRAIVLDVALPA
ncbi:endonuclease/exonuclease/phosphatase family protein, partial [Cellulomonas septica]